MRMRMTHARFQSYFSEVERKWPNDCGHKESEYIGSVLVRMSKTSLKTTPVDVYVHEGDLGTNQAHVCIRFGPKSEYVSAGTVMDFLATCAAEPTFYPEVIALILKKMEFFCERKGR